MGKACKKKNNSTQTLKPTSGLSLVFLNGWFGTQTWIKVVPILVLLSVVIIPGSNL